VAGRSALGNNRFRQERLVLPLVQLRFRLVNRLAAASVSCLMARGDVQQTDVYAAIAEYDQLGQEDFLEKYKMGKATSYLLRHEGKDYDSEAS
jgi:hypothetical protein